MNIVDIDVKYMFLLIVRKIFYDVYFRCCYYLSFVIDI